MLGFSIKIIGLLGGAIPKRVISIPIEKYWIISIISDLRDFSQYNGLPKSAEQLEYAAVVGLMGLDFETDRGSVPGRSVCDSVLLSAKYDLQSHWCARCIDAGAADPWSVHAQSAF